jgi:hypothetical protein
MSQPGAGDLRRTSTFWLNAYLHIEGVTCMKISLSR